jgi:adenine/guanine phosphoribosyltransferase-like PRPP-binding protein
MIDRRAFLQAAMLGAGVVTLGPQARGLAAAAAAATGFPKRFVFIRKSNGQRPNELVPLTLPANLMAKV